MTHGEALSAKLDAEDAYKEATSQAETDLDYAEIVCESKKEKANREYYEAEDAFTQAIRRADAELLKALELFRFWTERPQP